MISPWAYIPRPIFSFIWLSSISKYKINELKIVIWDVDKKDVYLYYIGLKSN